MSKRDSYKSSMGEFSTFYIYLLGWSGTESIIIENTYWPIGLALGDR
jgi:hypothetical protein